MSTSVQSFGRWVALLICCLVLTAAHAQDTAAPAIAPAADGKTTTFDSSSKDSPLGDDPDSEHDDEHDVDDWSIRHPHRHHSHGHGDGVVSIGRGAQLRAGEHADGVVAIFGSATSAGIVNDAVVSVLGSTRVTGGTVGESAVAVMGSVYINGEVNGDVVAVMGNVELGPEAKVHGDVVIVGGDLKRDSAAVVDGHLQNVLGVDWATFDWMRPWVERCLLYGRPLAFSPGLGWAWGIALGLLAFYVFIALVFRGVVDRCVRTLETEPGHSILAALLLTLGVPVLFVLLFVTVLGIAAVPFLVIAVFCAALFGKVVVLAAIGKRCTPFLANDPTVHTLVGVIVGGLIALMIYTIPIVGFVVYKFLELLGLGVVVYTLLLSVRAGRARAGGPGPGHGGSNLGAGLGTGGPGLGGRNPEAGEFTSARGAGSEAAGGPGASSGTTGQSPLDAAALPRAGFGIRMGALLLDVILVGILVHQLHDHGDVVLLALAIYGAIMWKLKGSTIGGIICGLQVVRVDGRPIDWPTAIVRALGCFLSLAVVGLGFIWIAIDADKQAWHDKIAGTAVVRAPKGASLL